MATILDVWRAECRDWNAVGRVPCCHDREQKLREVGVHLQLATFVEAIEPQLAPGPL